MYVLHKTRAHKGTGTSLVQIPPSAPQRSCMWRPTQHIVFILHTIKHHHSSSSSLSHPSLINTTAYFDETIPVSSGFGPFHVVIQTMDTNKLQHRDRWSTPEATSIPPTVPEAAVSYGDHHRSPRTPELVALTAQHKHRQDLSGVQ